MTALYDVAGIGNAIVDVIAQCDDAFLAKEGLTKGSMALIDPARAASLYDAMASGIEASGGSVANTMAGIASFGGKAAYIGKVADDQLGRVFRHDMNAIGCVFTTPALAEGPATAQSLINVTADAQRTMSTYLGACVELSSADVDPEIIEAAQVSYLEGYLFDPPEARRAFAKAAALAHGAGRKIAITLSDSFVVERHRAGLLGFIQTQCDIVFANAAEVCALFETDDFDAATKALAEMVEIAAVTRSEKGSVVASGGQLHEISAYPVEKVVDTTGAGDQYAAGFLYGLTQGRPLPVCGQLGSLAAAEVIDHYGPRPQVSLRELAAKNGL
ncbi:adenosine kinase [Caulobacter sp. FWC2]|uniref:adenosine kinase n=1 Tax=Caulobacter sp. FWC2 TaxID=69664 RepID=UPI000C15A253|nr:adenosine kinase [Caulobacter sp. FWC2]PIB94398.1 adenosine kinase [Caulobacter sp. FWC2]